mmetsp:Transcript_15833/g.37357  ORF Transcript_15833/g.37357 Transcript_15833/m.37357 type:complete len:463 (-) Transcript_15833:48-1436(-)
MQTFMASFSISFTNSCSMRFLSASSRIGIFRASANTSEASVQVALASSLRAAAQPRAASLAASLAPSMFSLSTSISLRSSGSLPMDLAASSRTRIMHTSRLSLQSLLTSLALSSPASFKALSTSARDGASPRSRPTPRASVARLRQLSLAASSTASSMQAAILSPSSLFISSSSTLRMMSSVMASAGRPVTLASISFALIMQASLSSSLQVSSSTQISSSTPSSRNSRTSESLTSSLPLPKASPTASLNSSLPRQARIASSVAASSMQPRNSWEISSLFPPRTRPLSSSGLTEPSGLPVKVARAAKASALSRQASLAASSDAASTQASTICFAFSEAMRRISPSSRSGLMVSFLSFSSIIFTSILQVSKVVVTLSMAMVQFSRVSTRATWAPFSASKRSLTGSGATPSASSNAALQVSSSLPLMRHLAKSPWTSRRGGGRSPSLGSSFCAAAPMRHARSSEA